MTSGRDTLGWVLGALTVGLGALYVYEDTQHEALWTAESHAATVKTPCTAHAAGPEGRTLMLTCAQKETPTRVPAFFDAVVVRQGQTQWLCGVTQGHVGPCESLADLP